MDGHGDSPPPTASTHHSGGSGMANSEMMSDYDPSTTSSGFTSIETTTRYYRYENGRRYQNFIEDRYPLPNDEAELTREEMMQHMAKKVLDGEFFMSPIDSHPQRILDLGCGGGQWAFDVADKFPSATVLAVDLAPLAPYLHPPNLEFKLDDIEADWPTAYSDADFIHARDVIPTLRYPSRLLESAFRNLRPGGWIEFEDVVARVCCDDGSLPPNNALQDFFRIWECEFSRRYQWDLRFPVRLPTELEAAGFVRVNVRRERIPIGPWVQNTRMREIGLWIQPILEHLIGNVLAKSREMNLTDAEAKALLEGTSKIINDDNIHAYLYWHSTWAQKPV